MRRRVWRRAGCGRGRWAGRGGWRWRQSGRRAGGCGGGIIYGRFVRGAGRVIVGEGDGISGGGYQGHVGHAGGADAADGYGDGFVGVVPGVVVRRDFEDAVPAACAVGDGERGSGGGEAHGVGRAAGLPHNHYIPGGVGLGDAGGPHSAGVQGGVDGDGLRAVILGDTGREAGERNRAGQPVAVQPEVAQAGQAAQFRRDAAGEAVVMQP